VSPPAAGPGYGVDPWRA